MRFLLGMKAFGEFLMLIFGAPIAFLLLYAYDHVFAWIGAAILIIAFNGYAILKNH